MVDFVFIIIKFFAVSYSWDVTCGNLSKSAFFEGGGSLWAQIADRRGRCPPCWCQKTRIIALWCGIKISAVHGLVLSQSTCERWMDRIMTPKTMLAWMEFHWIFVTDVSAFVGVLISFWDQRSKLKVTASNDHNIPDEYSIFVNIQLVLPKLAHVCIWPGTYW